VFLFRSFLRELQKIILAALPSLKENPATGFMAGMLLLIYALAACVPEREVDSLWYHLAVPLYYSTHGGAVQLVPFNMPSHYPMNVHLHFTLSLLVGNDTTVKVFILCHFIPFLILLWSVVKRYGSASWGIFAIVVYLCCLHFRLPVMANVQRPLYLHLFLSTVLLWDALEKENNKHFLLAALFCGMAMGTKFNGLLFGYVAQWILIFGWIVFKWRDQLLVGLQKWVVHSLIAWAMMSPWLIKSYVLTRNPFYPMLGNLFSTNPDFVPAMLSNDRNHGLNILKSDSIQEFLLQVSTNIAWLLYNDDLIFFLGLLALLFLLFFPYRNITIPLASGGIAYALFPMLWGSDIARLFAVNYGVIVLLITIAVQTISDRISSGRRFHRILYWLVLLSLFVTFLQQRYFYLKSPNIRWFGGVYLSEPARQAWVTERGIFSPNLFRMRDYLRENIDPEEELYGYRTGYLFYLDRKCIVSGAHFGEQMDGWLQTGPGFAALRLKELGVRWFVYDTHADDPFANQEHPRLQEFIERFCERVHSEGTIQLYRVNRD